MMIFLIALIPIFWLVFILYWIISAIRSKKTIRTRTWWYGAVIRVIFFIIVIALLQTSRLGSISVYLIRPYSGLLGICIGTLLCAVGIGSAIWARVYLGRNWGMPMSVKENPELVMSGPYRFVRHPIYSGVLLAMLGSGIAGAGIWMLVFIFFGTYFIYSATREEKLMTREFPEQYPEYKKRTKMLIPFIF